MAPRNDLADPTADSRADPMMGSRPSGGGGRAGAARAWVGWWLASAALYVVLVDTVVESELITGAVIATVAASAATLVRAQRRVVMRPRAVWLVGLWRPIASYPRDLWTLTRVLFSRRRTSGTFYALPFEPGADDAQPATRRVLGPSAGSFAPNTFAVGLDPEHGLLLIHQLVASPDPAADADPLGIR